MVESRVATQTDFDDSAGERQVLLISSIRETVAADDLVNLGLGTSLHFREGRDMSTEPLLDSGGLKDSMLVTRGL